MALNDRQIEVLGDVVGDETTHRIGEMLEGNEVAAWSVFDCDSTEFAKDGVSETTTAVCSNVLDLASLIGVDLGEAPSTPKVLFKKGAIEMSIVPLEIANLMLLKETYSARKG